MNFWKTFAKVMLLVCALIVLTTFRSGVSAQSTASTEDPLRALLTEVHALRIAMEQQATISPRIQLSMARLNIEEQRMAQLSQQLNEIRKQLSDMAAESQNLATRLPEIDRMVQMEKDEKKRAEIIDLQQDLVRRQKEQSTREQQLRIRENEAARTLDSEQTRWIELNNRIDELERLLAPAAKPQQQN